MSRLSINKGSRIHRLVIGHLLAIALSLCLTHSSSGQGTMGTVPDPISARDLDRYVKRLGLSEQQRQAIDAIHDQYKADFSQLRDGDIETFLNESRNMGGGRGGGMGGMGGMGMIFNIDRKQLQKTIRDFEEVLSKIKTVDNQLFDQVQTVLTEEQVALLQGVRQARERVRYRSGAVQMTIFTNPATQVDVSEIVYDMDLSPQEKQDAGPIVSQYESSLTSAMRKLHEGSINLVNELFDKLQAQGLNGDSMRDPENRGKLFEAFRNIYGPLNTKQMERASDIAELNRKTAKTLMPLLSTDHARSLHDQYFQRAYPDAGGNGQASRAFGLALKYKELTDEQRQSISAMASEYFASADHLADQMADALDTNRKTQSLFDFDPDKRRKFEEQLDVLREKRNKLNESTLASLKASLGTQLAEKLETHLAKPGDGQILMPESVTLTATGPGGGVTTFSARINTSSESSAAAVTIDPFIPNAITKRDLDDYSSRLHLNDDNKSILVSLHDDYMEKYRGIEQSDIKTAREAERNLWSMNGGEGQVSPPTAEAIDHLYDLRRRALDSIKAIDAEFFENVKAALAGDDQQVAMQRIVQSRQREIYNRSAGGGGMFGFGGGGGRGRFNGPGGGGPNGPGGGGRGRFGTFIGANNESSVDIVKVVDDVKPKPADPVQFNAMVVDYETAVTAAFQSAYESQMKAQQAMEKLTAQMTSQRGAGGPGGGAGGPGGNRGGGPGGPGNGFRELMEGDGRVAREAKQAIATLNRETIAKLVAALPETEAQSLRRAYNRKAFADVYNDSRSAEPQLNAALKLADLSDQQRSQIQEIAAEYRGNYEAMCDKMIELETAAAAAGNPMMGGGGPGGNGGGRGQGGGRGPDWQTMQDQMRNREKLDFERNDLSDKAIARLRGALNEEQVQRLGGLQTEAKQASN